MTADFNAYYQWLGIPLEEQPANHYRLLGVRAFERDLEVIANSADRQTTHLRNYQTGQHAALAHKLLNEVARARVTLLKPESKAAYDEQLRRRRATRAKTPVAAPVPVAKTVGPAAPTAAVKVTARAPIATARQAGTTASKDADPFGLDSLGANPLGLDPFAADSQRARPKKKSSSLSPMLVTGGIGGLCLVAGVVVWLVLPGDSPTPPGEQSQSTAGGPITPQAIASAGTAAPKAAPPHQHSGTRVAAELNLEHDAPAAGPSQPSTEPAEPPQAPPGAKAGKFVFLMDLPATEVRIFENIPITWRPPYGVSVGGQESRGDLYMHSLPGESAHAAWDLTNNKFRYLVGGAGISDKIRGGGSDQTFTPMTFRIVGDGKPLWKSEPLQVSGKSQAFAVAVKSVKRLELFVDCPGRNDYGQTIWMAPRLTNDRDSPEKTPGDKEQVAEPNATLPADSAEPVTSAVANADDSVVPAEADESSEAPTKDTRLPVPPAAEIAAATAEIRALFKDNYAAAKTPSAKSDCAEKLLTLYESSEDPRERYALISEALKVAMSANNPALAMDVIKLLATDFQVQRIEMATDICEQFARKELTPTGRSELLDVVVALIDDAMDTGEYKYVKRLANVGLPLVRKGSKTDVTKNLQAAVKRATELEEMAAAAETARERLRENSENAVAHWTLGTFLIASQGDWPAALEHLSKASDDSVRSAVERDLADPSEADAEVKLGDTWYELAEKQSGVLKDAFAPGPDFGMSSLSMTCRA